MLLVTDATARDTDEIATEEMPLYFRHPGRGIRPGHRVPAAVLRSPADRGPGDRGATATTRRS